MPGASVAVLPASASSTPGSRKASLVPERKYKCQFCNRAFSRSEHRSRHERSRTYFPRSDTLFSSLCLCRRHELPPLYTAQNQLSRHVYLPPFTQYSLFLWSYSFDWHSRPSNTIVDEGVAGTWTPGLINQCLYRYQGASVQVHEV